eukprot:jgi/Tetstr1/441952/TSEL_030157.t1
MIKTEETPASRELERLASISIRVTFQRRAQKRLHRQGHRSARHWGAMGCVFSCLGFYLCCPLEEVRVLCAHWLNLWLLQHPGWFAWLVRTFWLSEYALLVDSAAFHERRRRVLGPNYCALGQVVVSEPKMLHKLLLEPQAKGPFLGLTVYDASKLPPCGLLWESDAAKGGKHDVIRARIDQIFFTGEELRRAGDEHARGLVAQLAGAVASRPREDVESGDLPSFIFLFCHYCLFGLKLQRDSPDFRALWEVFYAPSPTLPRNLVWYTRYPHAVAAVMEKLTGIRIFGLDTVGQHLEDAAAIYLRSPVMQGAPSSEETPLQDVARAMTAVVGIAALQGSKHVLANCIYSLPPEFQVPWQESDEKLRLVVLEVARRWHAVDGTTVVATEPMEVEIRGKKTTFPAGTPVFLNLMLGDRDPEVFGDDPLEFNPYRRNLCPYLLAFNSLGDRSPQHRKCPGRLLVEAMGCAVLRKVHSSRHGRMDAVAIPMATHAATSPALPGMTENEAGDSSPRWQPYTILVETGNHTLWKAGTDAGVFVELIGEHGSSAPLKLDNFLVNDFEAGSTGVFNVDVQVPSVRGLGELLAVRVLKSKEWLGHRQDEERTLSIAPELFDFHGEWLLERLVVQLGAEGVKRWVFPAYAWLVADKPRTFFAGLAYTPGSTPEWMQPLRAAELERVRAARELAVSPGLPSHVAAIPRDDFFPNKRSVEVASLAVSSALNTKLQLLAERLDVDGVTMKDYDDIYDFIPRPEIADVWRDDSIFGATFLMGANPSWIRRCAAVPEGMLLDGAMLEGVLPHGTTLQSELDAGRVFSADYRMIETAMLPPATAQELSRYVAPCVCLFHSQPDRARTSRALTAMSTRFSATTPAATPLGLGPNTVNKLATQLYTQEWKPFNLPRDLRERGVDDTAALPWYRFRDDGLLLWDAIRGYVEEYVDIYYHCDADVSADAELMAFMEEFQQDGLGRLTDPAGEDRKPTLLPPPASMNKAALCEFLTETIFTGSALHAARNFCQYEQGSYIPYKSPHLRTPPPAEKGKCSEATFLAALPDLQSACKACEVLRLLSSYSESDVYMMGDRPKEWLYDASALQAVERFQSRLKEVEGTIQSRNEGQPQVLQYPWLLPSKLPCSIAI